MKTIYRSVKYPKRYTFFVVLFIIIIGGIMTHKLICDDERDIFRYIYSSAYILLWCLMGHRAFYSKTVIDDEQRIVHLDLGTYLIHKRNIEIDQITMLEVHKKKNGKIKKLLIRTTPNLFYEARPYQGQGFVDHLTRLNPNIQLVDRKASFVG